MSLLVATSGCVSNHRVSPWGGGSLPPISAFAAPSDLEAQLAAVDAETGALGLRKTLELRGELPRGGGPVIARGYEKTDAAGRIAHAVRVATAHGVVLAIGPFNEPEVDDRHAELVSAHAQDALASADDTVTRALTDLNGDGLPDAVLRNRRGTLELHRIGPLGSNRYDVIMFVAPTELADADGDGRLDLVGRAEAAEGDPIAPVLVDTATFDGGRYTNATAGARAFHAQRADPQPARSKNPPPPPDDATRLRGAIERAWHAILAGRPRARVLEALGGEPVPAALRAAFDRHRARIEALPVLDADKSGNAR
ncbi:FG-GAP repeat domain-containing protein [Polyangium aurulentum]|uniref:FG-GAP repeat domain-containing protein n=1 Tax=Polyangium aurulentum TaxID=2567896 RepID=UPI0010ADCA6A|nr:VCBS repeat-containing protein [Polyangium aurulentum]UQA57940.1 VCBS repeat-containing protein [Polyangium aurulentum]